MGICWYCHWGWSKAVVDIYKKYLAIAGEGAMHFGPAHIVWEDENFEREHVQWCFDHFDDGTENPDEDDDVFTAAQYTAVRHSLEDLLLLDDDHLSPEPRDYGGENPDNFPPQVEMARC